MIILICLLSAYIFSELCKKLQLPTVIGPILVGVVFGIPIIKNYLFDGGSSPIIELLSNVGQIFLLFFVGLEMDFKAFMRSSKRASLIAIIASFMPLILGFLVARALGINMLGALAVGICCSISAEAILIQILQELNLVQSKFGETVIEAGVFDDTIGIILITGLITFIRTTSTVEIQFTIIRIIFEIILFAAIIYLIRFFFLPVIWKFVEREHSEIGEFTGALIIAIFIAILASKFSLSAIVGAVIAGMVFRQVLYHEGIQGIKEEKRITKFFEIITFGFFALFFFIWVGLQTNITDLMINPIFGIILTVLAFSGKFFGTLIGNWIAAGNLHEGVIMGWGMNSRGAVELIVAQIALANNIIDHNLFSAIVFMAITTSIISPIVFKYMLKKYVANLEKDHKRVRI